MGLRFGVTYIFVFFTGEIVMSGHAASAGSSAAESAVPTSYVRDLAAQIYIGMVPSVMLKAGTAEQPKPNPVDLAKYCYKLAEAFQSSLTGRETQDAMAMAINEKYVIMT